MKGNIERSIGYLKKTKRELGLFLDDLKTSENSNTTVKQEHYYAVDFSEIFAYVEPEKTRDELDFLPNLTDEENTELQNRSLNKLFEGHEKPLLLLEPYKIELANHLRIWKDRNISYLKNSAASAIKEWKKLRTEPKFIRFMEIAEKINKSEPFTENEKDFCTDYLVEHASSILKMKEKSFESPIKRLRKLFQKTNFVESAALGLEANPDLDEDKIENCFELMWGNTKFSSQNDKKRQNKYSDARALVELELINKHLEPKNTKVILVTRSDFMSRLTENNELILEKSYVHIRHLRQFSYQSIYDVDKEEFQQTESQVKTVFKSLVALIAAYEKQTETKSELDQSLMSQIDDFLAELNTMWLKGSNLVTLAEFVHQNDERVAISEHQNEVGDQALLSQQVERVIGLFSESTIADNLLSAIHEHIIDELFTVEKDSQLLSLMISANSPGNKEQIEGKTDLPKLDDGYSLSSKKYSESPYYLHFRCKEITQIYKKIGKSDTLDFFEFIQELRTVPRESIHEAQLMISFIYGLLGYWELAAEFAEIALLSCVNKKNNRYEIYYFNAVCSYNLNKNEAGLKQCLEFLEEAKKEKPVGVDIDFDPRILKERGRILASWNALNPVTFAEAGNSLKDVVNAMESAIKYARVGTSMQLQSINNLAYFYSENMDLYEKECNDTVKEFRRILFEYDESPAKWPASIADTYYWTKWKLSRGKLSITKQKELISLLAFAENDRFITDNQRQTIRQHLQIIKNATK